MNSPPFRRASCSRRSCAGWSWSRIWRSRPKRVMPGTAGPAMTKSESSRRVRIAPGDEFRHDKAFAASPVLHVIALGIGDLAAGRGDERVSRRDVPFAGRGEAGIDVDCPLRPAAAFDRKAKHPPECTGPALGKGFGPDI